MLLNEDYLIKKLEKRKDVKKILEFLLSEDSFDDRNFTKGEIIQMKKLPNFMLKQPNFKFWYVENTYQQILGVISLRENEQKSAGYIIDYIAVHNKNRKRGIAQKLLNTAVECAKKMDGRYIQINTCNTLLYEDARKLFEKNGFSAIGYLPDYYFEGEGMIQYYKKIK